MRGSRFGRIGGGGCRRGGLQDGKMAGLKAVKSATLVFTAVLLAITSARALRDTGVKLSTGKRSSRVAAGVDTQRKVMRLRGGVMWVGGGKQFNRTADPDASPEAQEDTFLPLRERLRAASGLKNLKKKFGPKYRTNEVVTLEQECKYRIKPQNLLRTQSLSVDLTAAQKFQKYVVAELGFQQNRVGIMYGRVDDKFNAFCDVIYEPPQSGTNESYKLLPDPDAANVDRVAALLGLRKVGWVFTARTRKCILSGEDIKVSCQLQKELEDMHGFDFAKAWVSAVITRNDTTGSIVFEAYQVSDLCMDMERRGVLKEAANSNKGYARTAEDVLVERKDTQKVDTDFFLNTVPIKTHSSPLFGNREAEFSIENRDTLPQVAKEIKHVLLCHKELPFPERLRDFHLLLYLAKTFDVVTDMPSLCKAIVEGHEVSQGHQLMIHTLGES